MLVFGRQKELEGKVEIGGDNYNINKEILCLHNKSLIINIVLDLTSTGQ